MLGHEQLNSKLMFMLTHTCPFESPTFMSFGEENSHFMQIVLVLFCLKKMSWSYNNFSGKKEKSSSIA